LGFDAPTKQTTGKEMSTMFVAGQMLAVDRGLPVSLLMISLATLRTTSNNRIIHGSFRSAGYVRQRRRHNVRSGKARGIIGVMNVAGLFHNPGI
jgi:hypothetical protein